MAKRVSILKELTIQVPDSLAERLSRVENRIPEIIARGLNDLPPLPNEIYRYILNFLVSGPTPEEIYRFMPTPEMQTRASQLLEKNRQGDLSTAEQAELDEYVKIDHLITMLKAQTLPYVTSKEPD